MTSLVHLLSNKNKFTNEHLSYGSLGQVSIMFLKNKNA